MILTVAAIKPLGHAKLEKVMEKGVKFEGLKRVRTLVWNNKNILYIL